MREYRIHFEQVNAMWIDVKASSPQAAINKAIKERKEYYPLPDTLEYPSGDERNIHDGELV